LSTSLLARKQRFFYAGKAVLFGLIVAQVISTVHVYLSNNELYRRTACIIEAGYQPVPNENILPHLKQFDAAFLGGLFFTLTIGAFLSLVSFSIGWFWVRMGKRKRWLLIPAVALWIVLIWAVNGNGFNPMATAYFLIVPVAVFGVTVRSVPENQENNRLSGLLFQFSPLVILVVLWTIQIDTRMFIDFRDKVLLSNNIGITINDFYYKYTLYPAEVFKSFDQRLLKTVNLDHIRDKRLTRQLEKKLNYYDYLRITENKDVDLTIFKEGDTLVFKNRSRPVLETTFEDFSANPRELLNAFSKKSDPYGFFRQFTFISLLIGLPVCLYILIYSIIRYVSAWVLSLRAASITASVSCLIIGLALLVPFHLNRGGRYEIGQVAQLIASENWQDRVTGLKVIYEKGLEVGNYKSYRRNLHSSYVPERYWVVMALGNSRKKETYGDLLALIDDPHLNVVCKVYYALGRRGDRSLVSILLRELNTSEHWYAQLYAYNALKELGWKQTKSK